MKIQPTERNALQVLENSLKAVPFLRIARITAQSSFGDYRPDFVVELRLPEGKRQILIVEYKRTGQPRYAREAANQFSRIMTNVPDSYGVFMAPYISPKSAEICTADGLGYLDLEGNCRLAFQQVFIHKEGFPNPFAKNRGIQSLYAPKASRLLRVLLMRPGRPWKTQALADEAQVSLGQVANVKKALLDREWIQVGDEGFRLVRPRDLLDEWAQHYSYRRHSIREFHTLSNPSELERELAQTCQSMGIRCALTGFSGARRVAPAVRGQRIAAYVGQLDDELAGRLNLKEVTSGANVSLMLPYDDGVYYGAQDDGGVWIVCPIQLYLDLITNKGRGEEAAEALMRQAISKLW